MLRDCMPSRPDPHSIWDEKEAMYPWLGTGGYGLPRFELPQHVYNPNTSSDYLKTGGF